MSLESTANRGFNLLGTTVLGMGGLLFGAVVFQEKDWSDKVDDGGFLILAVGAIAWYLWRSNRFDRSAAHVAGAAIAVLLQIAGLILERDDPKAFGDNIGGMLYFGAAMILLAFQYRATRRIRMPGPPRSSTPPTRSRR